ncbi:MAG: hypothetical protein Q9169_007246 [Polycauliona sp. 2 TL-2023]
MSMEADEKIGDSGVNGSEGEALSHLHMDDDPVYSYEEQRAIIRRIDRRLVVTLGFIYCMSQIDRGNLGNASIAGMTEDLALDVGYRYVGIVSEDPSLPLLTRCHTSFDRFDPQAGPSQDPGYYYTIVGCDNDSTYPFS